ncbi:MAG: UMP kinase [Spirochaetales bacterium]|jgi:uridylate kinase|nr:UMP kinase [Spirochaetales bacterium]
MKVISLGGSIVAPEAVDTAYLKDFCLLVREYLAEDAGRKLILVIGGGGPARAYQGAYREIADKPENEAQDWIGIAATRLNGELVRGLFPAECRDPLAIDPRNAPFTGRVLIAAGWKPGFSSDYDAVFLAEKFGADTVINLSNINKVYTADPKKDPAAKPLDRLSWREFLEVVGDEWTPGKNAPFDPVAARKAADLKMQVIVAAGKDLDNLRKILTDKPFTGTLIAG